jgi:hypothetical protein
MFSSLEVCVARRLEEERTKSGIVLLLLTCWSQNAARAGPVTAAIARRGNRSASRRWRFDPQISLAAADIIVDSENAVSVTTRFDATMSDECHPAKPAAALA